MKKKYYDSKTYKWKLKMLYRWNDVRACDSTNLTDKQVHYSALRSKDG